MEKMRLAALQEPMGQTITSLHLIWVLTWLKFLPRTRRESAKLFWLFAEPAGQLGILIFIFTFIGRSPAYGTSMSLFLLTGITMLNFFSIGSGMVMRAITQSNNKLRLSTIGIFHDAIASVIFKLITAIGYTSILLAGVWYIQDINVIPRHPLIAAQAFIWSCVLCLGVGMLRAYATKFLPLIERIYGTISRGLIFISGIFYVPSFMPPQIRDLLSYNPILHIVELFRLGMYDQYPTIIYSPIFLQFFSIGCVALGATLIWHKRSDIME